MDPNSDPRRREAWNELNSQYDIIEDHVFESCNEGKLMRSFSCQYQLESAPPNPPSQPQEPQSRESNPQPYLGNVSQASLDTLDPAAWQLSIQPPNNPPSTNAALNHQDVYYPNVNFDYSTTCGMLLPRQYPLPPASSAMDEIPGFNSIPGVWEGRKLAHETIDFSNVDFDFNSFPPDLLFPEENSSVVNLPQYPPESDQESLPFDARISRRPSVSSYSLSSNGVVPPFEVSELPGYPEAPTHGSDYTPRSSLALSSTPLSPLLSPRCPQQPDVNRIASTRSRASPSPRPSMRTAPYTLDGGRKRWSTGSYGFPSTRRSSFSQNHPDGSAQQVANSSRFSMPSSTLKNLAPSNLAGASNSGGKPARFHRSPFLLPSNIDSTGRFAKPVPLASNGPFRTLDSNAGHRGHVLDQYADLSDPPDLLGPLKEKQLSPPPEDKNPEDPDLKPHEQDLRFDNDLYTPKWVRGHGNKREGWCGICKPGRWLVLKNSAFWYDKSFTHGISAATGQTFEGPEEVRRMEGSTEVWEGLCGSCGEWIALVSSKKKGTTWFRHAYKCHIHPKVKDVPKRNRESTVRGRPSSSSSSSKPPTSTGVSVKQDPQTPPPLPSSKIVGDEVLPGVKTVSPLQCISSMI